MLVTEIEEHAKLPILNCFSRTTLKAAIILLPLLGVTWVIGLFAVDENTEVFAWLFTIFNSLQVCVY